jgi:hypothetical protein
MTKAENDEAPIHARRLPIWLFVLLCALSAISGATVFLVLGALVSGALEIKNPDTKALLGITFILFGAVLPIIILTKMRQRSRRRKLADGPRSEKQFLREPSPAQEPRFAAPEIDPADDHSDDSMWYYVDNGERQGPVSASELTRLLDANHVNHDTKVWRSGLKDWISAADAGLVDSNLNVPPVASELVNNNLAWLIAFLPLMFGIFDIIARQLSFEEGFQLGIAWGSGGPAPALWFTYMLQNGLLWYGYFVLNLIITGLDAKRVYRAGYPGNLLVQVFILPAPVYLFMRAHRLKQSPRYGFVWIACFVLMLFL